ncbi:MAG: aldo/keto reductase [Desulfobacterales bacterium]|jgi:hypothetical protein
MTDIKHNVSRRKFLKTSAAAGLGSMISPIDCLATSPPQSQVVPTRPFGNTGVDVPILAFGGSLDTSMSTLLLKQAVKWGVTYWDTAASYMGGKSERGIGRYISKYPEDRKKIFLVTKSYTWTPRDMTRDLNTSLERMKTDYIDLYFLHAVRNVSGLGNELKTWAEKAKSAGKIRFFGFSTHGNMETLLLEASKLGWIDGIMMTYNFRLMHEDNMRRGVDACYKAGVGLIAMKTQGGGQIRTDTEVELELGGRFLQKGYTEAQARLKAVWENPQIAGICSEMPNTTLLMSNVAAATDRTKLSGRDLELLQQYAKETRSDYCAGCADICEPAVEGKIPICDVMRYLMYARSYGSQHKAMKGYHKLPLSTRMRMANTDYTLAEQRCPRRIPIGALMQEAENELA